MKKILLILLLAPQLLLGQIATSNLAIGIYASRPSGPLPDVVIGTQTWMGYDLNVTTYRNGVPIPEVTSDASWAALTTHGRAYYDNTSSYGAIFGQLYNFYAVTNANGICPTGYHVPNNTEWNTLITYLGGISLVGGAIKEPSLTYWEAPNPTGTYSGFRSLPGGLRLTNGTFESATGYSYYYSTTNDGTLASAYSAGFSTTYMWEYINFFDKRYGFSVRCIKD